MRWHVNSLTAVGLGLTLAFPAHADRLAAPANPLYQEECGACHLAYPPALLDAHSWLHVMNGLPKHFGTDASLDDKRRLAIVDFLGRHAGSRKTGVTANAKGEPLTRITETAYFQRKHRKLDTAVFQRAAIKSPANCAACHLDAAKGDFEDDRVRIPK